VDAEAAAGRGRGRPVCRQVLASVHAWEEQTPPLPPAGWAGTAWRSRPSRLRPRPFSGKASCALDLTTAKPVLLASLAIDLGWPPRHACLQLAPTLVNACRWPPPTSYGMKKGRVPAQNFFTRSLLVYNCSYGRFQ
jgi:hypothetical protein